MCVVMCATQLPLASGTGKLEERVSGIMKEVDAKNTGSEKAVDAKIIGFEKAADLKVRFLLRVQLHARSTPLAHLPSTPLSQYETK